MEAHWRGVLVSNGVKKNSPTTKDYVALLDAMKLDKYAVTFPNYHWLAALKPYEEWDTKNPTRSLVWYDAHNAVKHNRETEFQKATLLRVFEAVSACVIMMVAQFGLHAGLGQDSELQSFFHLSAFPSFPLSEVYMHPFGKPDRSPVNFDFQTESCASRRRPSRNQHRPAPGAAPDRGRRRGRPG